MKNIIRKLLLFLIKKIKLDVDIYTLVDGSWQFFVRRKFKIIPAIDQVVPIQYNDEWKNYKIIKVYNDGRAILKINVQEDTDMAPTVHGDEIEAYSIIQKFLNRFRR